MFVDPIKMMVEEGKQISLYITAPPPNGKYLELRWYKGSLSRTVAFYHHEISERTRYFDGYCSTNTSPCFTSHKVNLDITTGRLTFYNVNVTDDDNYYYKFYGENAIDTGYKYEIQLFVYSKLGFLLLGCGKFGWITRNRHRLSHTRKVDLLLGPFSQQRQQENEKKWSVESFPLLAIIAKCGCSVRQWPLLYQAWLRC